MYDNFLNTGVYQTLLHFRFIINNDVVIVILHRQPYGIFIY